MLLALIIISLSLLLGLTLFIIIKNNNNMATLKEQIDTKFAEVGTSLLNIAEDIRVLTTRGEGGLTKAEAEDVLSRLSTVADGLKAVDETTPGETV